MGIGPFSFTLARQKVIDFTVGHSEEPTSILIPPPVEESKLLSCSKPFKFEVFYIYTLSNILL